MSFGLPSKTHALCASVYRLVQDFLAAKRDLTRSVNYASWRIASPKLLLYEKGFSSLQDMDTSANLDLNPAASAPD